jgi:hypothetical protein
MLSQPNEVIVWRDAEHELPDDEMTVMVFAPDAATEAWPGYVLDGQWIWQNGIRVACKVIAWAEMPQGPGKNGKTEE